MNIELQPHEHAFRDEVRAFLDAELTDGMREAGAQATSVFLDPQHTLPWQRALNRRGWAAPAWPVEHGGPGWGEMERYIFAAECAAASAPPLAPMGLKMIGPCLMGFGTPEQKDRLLPRILSGEDYWCQGYSEPGAGSDLAALSLRAVRDGDAYVLDGSKIWTTHAHFANRMFCLARTDAGGRPQQGITFLLVHMDAPGLTVSPIVTLAGEHEVNQVFFEGVRVPVEERVGAEGDGWRVAKYLLEFERGGASAPGLKARLGRLRESAAATLSVGGRPLLADPAFARELAETEIAVEALSVTELRTLDALRGGGSPGAMSSMLKILGSEAVQRVDALGVTIAGLYAQPWRQEASAPGANLAPVGPQDVATAMPRYLNDRAATIYGGSNEVQRGILAKAQLGL